jgi:ABC-2 type transport system permease protein
MNAFTGTGSLVRLALRRDRVRLPVWILALAFFAVSSAAATVGLYPTEASRVEAAKSFNSTQALLALYGPVYDPTSIGALSIIKLAGTGAIFVAVLAILTIVRHTRAEEESGRSELVGATVVGRRAPLTAALIVMIGASLVLGLLTALGLIASDLPAAGSLAFGMTWAGVGIAFAAIAAITAQMTRTARSATGLAIAVLGVAYLLRAIGDTASSSGPRWLSWLSPVGWGQQIRPYAGDRWWVALIIVGFTAVASGGAYALIARRDLGSGLLAERPGPAVAAPYLRSTLALAWRLQRGTLLAWASGFALLGLVFGSIASNVDGFAGSQQARDVFAKLGGQNALTDAYLATVLGIVGVMASAYGVQAAMRLRTEETELRAEPLLATGITRTSWVMSHTMVALLGTTLLVVVNGLCAGLVYGVQDSDLGQVGRVLGGALVQLPAAWLLTGILVAAFGLVPRWVAIGWVALAGFLLLGELGPVFDLNHWVMDVSPFAHVPRLPGSALHLTPILVLTAIAALLTAAGVLGFRRRDLTAG